MNTLKKMLFLTNNTHSKTMATLKLEKNNNNVLGIFKTYHTIPDGEYLLGIKNDNNIIKQNTNIKDGSYSFILSNNFNMDTNIGCVLLSLNNNELNPILWGNEKDKNYKNIIVTSLKDSFAKLHKDQQKNYHNTQTMQSQSPYSVSDHPTQTDINSSNEYKLPTNSPHENSNVINDFQNKETRQQNSPHQNLSMFYNSLSLDDNFVTNQPNIESFSQISIEEEILPPIDDIAVASSQTISPSLFEEDEKLEEIIDNEINKENKNSHEFYNMIADQLDEIFSRYPRESNLEILVPNSKWAKLDTDTENKHYVVGIIYYNDEEKYICYGVPGSYHIEPPIEIRKYSQWLPTDPQNPYTNGYWVMYQDADTGENIYLNN